MWSRVEQGRTRPPAAALLLAAHATPSNRALTSITPSPGAWKSGGLTAGTTYSTSKGGLNSLTFSVAREFADCGITANGVRCGPVVFLIVSSFVALFLPLTVQHPCLFNSDRAVLRHVPDDHQAVD